MVVLAMVIVAGVLFASEAGQAIAQKIFQFFAVTEATSFPLPTGQAFVVPSTATPAPVVILPLEPAAIQVQPVPSQPVDTDSATLCLAEHIFLPGAEG